MLARRIFLKNMGLAGVFLSPLMPVCRAMAKDHPGAKDKEKGKSMDIDGSQKISGSSMPALDIRVPSHLMTATFALG